MPDEKTQQGVSPEPINLLQNKPQRRSRRGPAVLLLLLGNALIVAVVAVVAWQTLAPHASSPGSSAAAKSHQSGNPVPLRWNDPAIYWQIIRTQVARPAPRRHPDHRAIAGGWRYQHGHACIDEQK
jgi:hypothetical protein